jgi:putative adhesin
MKNKHLLFPAFVAVLFLSTVAFASEDGRFERTLKVTGVPQVEVQTGSGNIDVRSGDNTSIKVIGHIHSNHGWFSGSNQAEKVRRIEQNPPIEQTGNIVHIGRFTDSELRRNISIDYEIWLPRESNLKANSGSGDVNVENLKSMLTVSTGSGNVKVNHNEGDVHANTGSGDVVLDGIGGNVNGETGSGNVTLAMNGNGTARLGTGSGDISAKGVRGGLRAHTGSGNVTADGDVTSDWQVETGSGDVRVSFPQNAKFELNAETGSGDLNIGREVLMSGNLNKHHVRGKVNGGGPLVQLQTSSGNIDLR